MLFLQKMFSIIDLYGLSIPLRYHQKEKFHTLYSSTLSLLTILGIFYVILKFTIIVLNYKEFSIIQNTEEILEKKLLDFSKIPILIGFINDGGRPIKIDSTYLSIILDKNEHYPEINEEGIMKLKRISTSIKLEYCNLTKHFSKDNNIINLIKDYEYENYLCPVPGQNLSIRGRWGDSINGYDILEFHLIKCENSNEEDRCKNEEEMNKFFKNSYMSIIYLSQSLNHHDVNNPIRYNFRSEVFLISSQVLKRYYYYFIPGEYISDNGYLFINKKIFNFFDYQTTIIDFVDEEDQNYYSKATLIEVAFSCLDRYFKYERKYLKFQDCFGNIGGWIRIILIVCQFISDYFSEKIFLNDIIKSISSFSNKQSFHSKIKVKRENIKTNNYFNNENNSSNYKSQFSSLSIKPSKKGNISENLDLSNVQIENFKIINKEKKNITLNLIDYCLPLWAMENNCKYSPFIAYKNIIYKDISLEFLIPLIEKFLRFNLFIEKENKIDLLSKLNCFK